MAAVRSQGLSVPEDISVVALHDIPQAAYLNPPLTTVRMPLAELGSRSVDMILTMINGAPGRACGCGDAARADRPRVGRRRRN